MKRILSLLVLLSVIVSLLAGCGGSANGTANHRPDMPSLDVEEEPDETQGCAHVFAEDGWKCVRSSNCSVQGYEECTCETCGYVETRQLPLGDHVYSNNVCKICDEPVPGNQELVFYSDMKNHEWYAYLAEMGECTDTDIVVPPFKQYYDDYEGEDRTLPVSGVALGFSFPDNVNSVTFLSPIYMMPSDLFRHHPNLKKVVFAEGQTTTSEYAFSACTNLTEVVLPSTMTSLGMGAFIGCTALETISIPGGIGQLPEKVFNKCTALKTVELSEGLFRIYERAFEGCSALESIQLPDTVDMIDEYAFNGCSGLLSIEFPDAVTILPSFVCGSAKKLNSVGIGKNVERIGTAAFMNCFVLKSITFPATLKEIEKKAFSGCSELETIIFEGTVDQWNQIQKGEDWNDYCPAVEVQCTDGVAPLVITP